MLEFCISFIVKTFFFFLLLSVDIKLSRLETNIGPYNSISIISYSVNQNLDLKASSTLISLFISEITLWNLNQHWDQVESDFYEQWRLVRNKCFIKLQSPEMCLSKRSLRKTDFFKMAKLEILRIRTDLKMKKM